jgi:hypothetical protein
MPEKLKQAAAAVSADRIRDQDKFLSDDLFEGRYPGLRGGELAAKYIATQFALMGLKPGGDHGTYLQQVNFVGMKAIPAQTHFELLPASGAPLLLKFGDDYTASNQTLTPVSTLDAPIVFVGYGITAPEYGWNDYAGMDVKGKVILCIVGDPPSDDSKFFAGRALTYYGRWTYKFEQAARMGAVGALIIHRTDLASYGWNVVQNSNTSEKTYLRDDANPRLKDASWIQLDVARKLFTRSGLDLDKEFEAAGTKGFKAIELPVRLKATLSSDVRPFQSPNVVGLLRPQQPCVGICPDQAVLYTAHYDHLGFVPGMAGDNIFNGAANNGTGVAMISRWRVPGLPPCRTVSRCRTRSSSPPSLRKNKVCSARSTSASTRPSPPRRSRWTSTTTCFCRLACRRRSTSTARSAPRSIPRWKLRPGASA